MSRIDVPEKASAHGLGLQDGSLGPSPFRAPLVGQYFSNQEHAVETLAVVFLLGYASLSIPSLFLGFLDGLFDVEHGRSAPPKMVRRIDILSMPWARAGYALGHFLGQPL